MKKNYYALFYQENENSYKHLIRPNCKLSQWNDYAQKLGLVKYKIVDFRTYNAHILHQTTNVVRYKGKYYLPDENIPYPKDNITSISKIDFELKLDEKIYELDSYKIEDALVELSIIISNKNFKQLSIYAKDFIKFFHIFETKLKNNNFAIYINDELSEFKWLAWIKNNKIRIIEQYYGFKNVRTDFDILIDINNFSEFSKNLLNQLKNFVNEY